MANKHATESAAVGLSGTLQRGKACLRCRKRKMRCDGSKPACQQCTRAKKVESCEYDDGKGKTRTQLLRENIARLEQRIRELEDPEYVSPAVTLHYPHHPHQRSQDSSSSSMAGSPESISLSHSPFPSEPASSPQESWTRLPGIPSPSPSPFGDTYFEERPPIELALMLIDIFAPHRHQCGLEIHMGRLRESLTRPASEQRHPVLMNAIFLWACFISRPEPLSQHEDHYLTRSLEGLTDALHIGDRLVDIIQASCLIALYFLSNGRLLEGSYHAGAATALALQCRLHNAVVYEDPEALGAFKLPPSKDSIEQGERILAFWQVYNLDRCWSAVLRKPVVISDGLNPWSSINVPWPQNIADYELGQLDGGSGFQTITAFLGGTLDGGFSTLALRVKASALYDRSNRLSSSWDPRLTPTSTFREDVQALEHTISCFLPTLIPPHQLDGTLPDDKHLLITAHTLALAARINLFTRFAPDDPRAHAKCLQATRGCVQVIKHIADADIPFLDPIIGPCWTMVAQTLVRELNNLESAWPLMNSTDVRSEIATVLYAMTSLCTRYPVISHSVSKIQKRLTL